MLDSSKITQDTSSVFKYFGHIRDIFRICLVLSGIMLDLSLSNVLLSQMYKDELLAAYNTVLAYPANA